MKMKKKAMATFLSVCMLAAIVVPTALVSATTPTTDAVEGSNTGDGNQQGDNTGDGNQQGDNTGDGNQQGDNTGDGNQQGDNTGDGNQQGDVTEDPPAVTDKAVTVTDGQGNKLQYDTLEEAIANAAAGSTVKLNKDVQINSALQISNGITLDGANYKISCGDQFTEDGSILSALVMVTGVNNQVNIKNVTIDGGAKNKFPLNIYNSSNVALTNVTVNNQFNNGGAMMVNASSVTVNGTLKISTTADSWYGINVDSGVGVETVPSTLTFAAGSKFAFANSANGKYDPNGKVGICVDNIDKQHSVKGYLDAGFGEPKTKPGADGKDQQLFQLAVKVTGVTLDPTTLELKPEETGTLTATTAVTPNNIVDQPVAFSSNNESVATVENDGTVTAVKDGTATITATVDGKTATCKVTVKTPTPDPEPEPTPDPDPTPDPEPTPTPTPDGQVTAPTPQLTPPEVQGNTTNVDAKVEVSQEALDKATAENPVKINVDLPTDSLKQTITESSTDNVALTVQIPDAAIDNANVSMAQIKMEKDVFAQLKASGKKLTIHVAGSYGKDIYSWTFDGSEVNDATINVNLALNVESSDSNQAMKEALGGKKGTVLSFAHHGNLPAKATVKVDVSASFAPGETAYFYYYNPQTKAMEAIGNGYLVDADGFVEVSITHCSDYVLTKEKLTTAGTINNGSLTTPQTGDNSNLAISIAAVTAASAAVTGFIVIKKRKSN